MTDLFSDCDKLLSHTMSLSKKKESNYIGATTGNLLDTLSAKFQGIGYQFTDTSRILTQNAISRCTLYHTAKKVIGMY